jgi:SAM-dependent methyltransferase
MSNNRASEYYNSTYFNGGEYQDYQSSEKTIKKNFQDFTEKLIRLKSSGDLLELGCAYGYFLDLAKKYWKIKGIDISADAIKSCSKRFGQDVICGDFLDIPFPPDSYDLITGFDMIEHVNHPREYIFKAFRILRKYGRLALTTGNMTSLSAILMGKKWRLLTPPGHLTFFSEQGMKGLLEEAGFKNISFTTAGYYRSMDFVAFRIFGKKTYNKIRQKFPMLHHILQSMAFYSNLRDIMFVTAQKIS